jgi:hypothetical protein
MVGYSNSGMENDAYVMKSFTTWTFDKLNENGQVKDDEVGWVCRRANNVTMNTGEIGWGGMDWLDLVQHKDQWKALVNMSSTQHFNKRSNLQ